MTDIDPSDEQKGWPVALRGVTESIVTTLGPNGRWNVAALGLFAPGAGVSSGERSVIHARTWGNTRTRRNFHRESGGVIQFTSDPREFVEAAVTIREEAEPVLPGSDAWVEVKVESVETGEDGGTRWEEWELRPVESAVIAERPYTIDRAFAAVVEATVAVSRLDVDSYDQTALLDRLDYFATVVDRCGGAETREAMATIDEETGWRERLHE